jgi:hypothetical protein
MKARPSLPSKLTILAVVLLSTALAAPAFGSSCWEKGNWRYSSGSVTIVARTAHADSGWIVTNRLYWAVKDGQDAKTPEINDEVIALKTKRERLWNDVELPYGVTSGRGVFFRMDFRSAGGIEETCTASFGSRGRERTSGGTTVESRFMRLECSNGSKIVSCGRAFNSSESRHRLRLTLK